MIYDSRFTIYDPVDVMTDPVHEIFIFPLNTVLFPGGSLPLKVFEQR